MSDVHYDAMRERRAGSVCWDQVLALVIAPMVLVVLAIIIPVLLLVQGRPVFYISERMKAPNSSFRLFKLRTMSKASTAGVLGGHAAHQVTAFGRFLRASRLDELPQLWNILRGDLRFIGPRPPLPKYVDAYPHLYARVLARRPGVTGLATVLFHAREAALLRACETAAATDRLYREICIPKKARLDLFYNEKKCLGLDLLILYWTFSRLLPGRRCKGPGAAGALALPHGASKVVGKRLHQV